MKILNIASGYTSADTYLMIDESGAAALVDPGGDAPHLKAEIIKSGARVTHILLTHGHFDHILALTELREFTHAPVCIHKLDAICLSDTTYSLMSMIGRSDTFAPAEELLEDKDVIRVGSSDISVIHTPGHTMGSVCYLTGRDLLTGDTLFKQSIGRTDFPGGDFETLEASVQKLYAQNGDYTVYPGHGEPTTLDAERLYNPYIKMKND